MARRKGIGKPITKLISAIGPIQSSNATIWFALFGDDEGGVFMLRRTKIGTGEVGLDMVVPLTPSLNNEVSDDLPDFAREALGL